MVTRTLLAIFGVLAIIVKSKASECVLHDSSHKSEISLLQKLSPIYGKILSTVEYDEKGKEKFEYKIGVCANPDPTLELAGAVQYDYANKSNNYTLGRFNETEIISGYNWLLLTYYGGDSYSNLCNNASRIAHIMIICVPETKGDTLKVIGETLAFQTPHCFYWFEFGSSLVCVKKEDKLSGGSIFCILTFTGFGFYLILGFFYRRFVVGAQGMEQIPNYTFWKDFGNLQADGCDFLCRCGGRREQNAYRGINENIPRNEVDRDRDDQLLTM